MLNKLLKLADKLDSKGLYEEANLLDELAQKYADDQAKRREPPPKTVMPKDKDLFPQPKTPDVEIKKPDEIQLADDDMDLEDEDLVSELKQVIDRLENTEMLADTPTVELPEKQPGDKEYFDYLAQKEQMQSRVMEPSKSKPLPELPTYEPSQPQKWQPKLYQPSGPAKK